MFYAKNKSKKLDKKLFENPTSEYRGTPFWAWNCKLDKEDLLWQIDVLKEMGFGGFHMHSRAGMATPYLSDEHMALIKRLRGKVPRQKRCWRWLYDEDRWPSGAAGGLLTQGPAVPCAAPAADHQALRRQAKTMRDWTRAPQSSAFGERRRCWPATTCGWTKTVA